MEKEIIHYKLRERESLKNEHNLIWPISITFHRIFMSIDLTWNILWKWDYFIWPNTHSYNCTSKDKLLVNFTNLLVNFIHYFKKYTFQRIRVIFIRSCDFWLYPSTDLHYNPSIKKMTTPLLYLNATIIVPKHIQHKTVCIPPRNSTQNEKHLQISNGSLSTKKKTLHYTELNLNYSPKGRSCVLEGVRTMGRLDLALLALLKPVAEVSTSDMIPGSSS